MEVGGIAKTVELDGYRFDLGGHRFFTNSPRAAPLGGDARRRVPDPAEALAHLLRRRVLRVPDAGRGRAGRLGLVESARCALLLHAARMRRADPPQTFEEWVTGASAAASTRRSSAPTPRRSGASRAARSRPSGPRSGSGTLLWRADLALASAARPEPARGVPLPAPRAGPDVGDVRGKGWGSAVFPSGEPPLTAHQPRRAGSKRS